MNRDKTFDRSSGEKTETAGLWQFRLYVNGRTALKTIVTLQNIRDLCDMRLAGRYELEVIDLMDNFARGREDDVIALPTLVRRAPLPIRKAIGELSNTDQVVTALGLPPASGFEG